MSARSELTKEQRGVVEHPAGVALCVVSGAGSGKTRVLVRRALRLLEGGYGPVLMVTFTRAAAEELRRRVADGDGMRERGGKKVDGLTFHALGLRVLRSCEDSVLEKCTGRRTGFTVFGRTEQMGLAATIIMGQSKSGVSKEALLRAVLSARACHASDVDANSTTAKRRLDAAVELYEARMKEINAFDIDELVSSAICILRTEGAVREAWRKRYKAILVDEFQDSTRSNFELLKLLTGLDTSITAVGDDDQSIYSFRGAERRNFAAFLSHFSQNAAQLCLNENHRSSGTVVAAANSIVASCTDRINKQLTTRNPAGSKVHVASCLNSASEAGFLAQQISVLHDEENVPYSAMAVLVRTRVLALDVRSRLQEHGTSFDASHHICSDLCSISLLTRKFYDGRHPGQALPSARSYLHSTGGFCWIERGIYRYGRGGSCTAVGK